MANSRKEARQQKKAAGKSKLLRNLAILLIIAGIGVIGYAALQRYMVNYNQAKLREEFETASAGFSHIEFGEEEVEDPGVVEELHITEWKPMRLIVPAIEMDLVTVGGDGVDVFDRAMLDKGPTHFQMSDLPNTDRGNIAFAGHRAGRWNFFLDLDQLEEGDDIFLDVEGYRFIYKVEWVKVFDKYDWSPIDSTDYPAITLQTCHPAHVSNPDWRLMARGALDKVIKLSVEAPAAN